MGKKISQPKQDRALQIAASLASNIQINGTMATEKQLFQVCYTALRLVDAMEHVIDAVENDDALAEAALINGDAYVQLSATLVKRKEERCKAPETEEVVNAPKGKAGKTSKETPPEGTQTPEV